MVPVRGCVLLCASLFAFLLCAGAADAPRDPAAVIREGLAQCEKGQAADAIRSLQQAIDLIQQQQQAGVEKYLPATIAGWKAGEVEKEQYAGGAGETQVAFFRVGRTFSREADDAELTVSLLNSPQYIDPQRELLKAWKGNPMILQAMNQDENVRMSLVERDGWAGWKKVDKGAPESQIILIGEGWLLEIRVGIADGDLVDKALAAVELKAIGKAGK